MSDVGYETPISEIDDDQMMPHDENITFDVSPTYVKYATITGAHLIHDKYCAEDGRCKRQKGLVEGLPKGFYCCKEIALTYNRTKFMKFTEDGKILVLNSNDATLGELDDESQDAVMAAIDGINKADLKAIGAHRGSDSPNGRVIYSTAGSAFDVDIYVRDSVSNVVK